MRNDPFIVPRRRRGPSRDIFGQRRRRRPPWGWILLVLLVVAGGLVVSRTGVDGAWEAVQSLLPAPDSTAPAPDDDAPIVPLALPPPSH